MLRLRSNCSVICVEPSVAGRRHLGDPGDAAELALERRRHRRGHRLRAGAGQAGGDLNRRKLHLRQRRDRQERVAERAGQREGDGEQRRADRPVDEGRGDVHAPPPARRWTDRRRRPARTRRQPIEREIDDRRGVQRQHLAEDQAADDRDAQRPAQLRAGAGAERQRHAPEQRRHRRHHDRPEAQQAAS